MTEPAQLAPARPVISVSGPLPYESLGITDAHNHMWIDPVRGAQPGSPVLDQYDLILQELLEYRKKGGSTLLDCQPPGCGRDGNQLLALSRASKVNLIACTGFHRKRYYHQEYWLWSASPQKIADFLCSELEQGLLETLDKPEPVRAGFIKIALEAAWSDCPQAGLEGAAWAAFRTRSLIEIHTEKGALAEKACFYFMERGVKADQLVLCHMDKRPDAGLHKELARLGVLLEYDTFHRPKYDPKANLWVLIDQMNRAGYSDRVALATDLAEAELYHSIGGGAGLSSLPGEILEQLIFKGIPEAACLQMIGGNIARRLAGIK
jgi:5-phospho-D-xylono-1,4-lactonase